MAYKRSRKEFEADLQAKQSPFVFFGTPLPPLDAEIRDDGSFVPVWKQEVTDEQGRKRLHGAFTGGFSAGYFNTVGSKEGWTPATFTSSRANKQKDVKSQPQQRPEDFMDDEDLADAADSKQLQTNQGFTGLGSTVDDEKRQGFLMDLLRPVGETAGVRLLQKMGWSQGQGVGPKVRRKAWLGDDVLPDAGTEAQLFAPEDSPMIRFVRKTDRHGVGYDAVSKLDTAQPPELAENDGDDSFDFARQRKGKIETKSAVQKNGFGIGVMNDTGSDEDDPYEMGPKISYNRVLGGDKKKAKKKATSGLAANPLLSSKPVFKPKRFQPQQDSRKCHDGRLPLEGFVLAQSLNAIDLNANDYTIPKIPEGWKSARTTTDDDGNSAEFKSTADAARESTLDAKGRAAILGEAQLPGKSVFDYISPAARDRLASASGKTNLPIARGEALSKTLFSKESPTIADTTQQIPHLGKDVAVAALGRGIGGWMPYSDNEAKRNRYRSFLEYHAGVVKSAPVAPPSLDKSAWDQELHEFARAAQVFKPMTGAMASRFTSASAPVVASQDSDPEADAQPPLLTMPSSLKAPEDPAEIAAKMGLFGPLTRTFQQFYPSRLLCKRFNVKHPDNVQRDPDDYNATTSAVPAEHAQTASEEPVKQLLLEASSSTKLSHSASAGGSNTKPEKLPPTYSAGLQSRVQVDSERNEALEGERAGEAMFKAIFGSDDSDSE